MRILMTNHPRRFISGLFPSLYCLSSCCLVSAIAIIVAPIWTQNQSLVSYFFRRIQVGSRSIRWFSISSTTNDNDGLPSSPTTAPCNFDYPLSWESILHIISTNRLHCLQRSKEQQQSYIQYLEEMKRCWIHPVDHILHTKFQFSKVALRSTEEEEESSKLIYEASPKLGQVSESIIKLCPNEYPYHMEENIQHWVLWKLLEPISHKEIHEAKQKLRNQHKTIIDTAHWVNPSHLKSIPEIDHVHIVCLHSNSQQRLN